MLTYVGSIQNLKDLKVSAYVGSSKNLKDLKETCKGTSTEQFPVSAYVGSSKNPKDLKDYNVCQVLTRRTERAVGAVGRRSLSSVHPHIGTPRPYVPAPPRRTSGIGLLGVQGGFGLL